MRIATLVLLLACIPTGHAKPHVDVTERDDGYIQIDFFNDTIEALRYLIVPEALTKREDPNLNDEDKWMIERKEPISGYFSASDKNRKDSLGSITLPKTFASVFGDCDSKRLAIILEWSDRNIEDWQQPEVKSTYHSIK